MGGLARRATLINQERGKGGDVLLLDAGNTWWGTLDPAAKSNGKVIVDAMNLMHYDVMALGEIDLQLGEPLLRQRLGEVQFPVVSVNVVVDATGQLLTQPYVLLDVGGRQVAIIGLTGMGTLPADQQLAPPPGATLAAPAPSPVSGPGVSAPPPTANKRVVGSLAVLDPESTLKSYLPEVQKQANVIIVLSSMGYEANQRLADAVPGLDLIISAGPGQIIPEPWKSPVNGTLLCQEGTYPQAHPGQTLGIAQLHVDSAGSITQYSGSAPVLGEELEDEPLIRKLLNDYQLQ